MKRDEKDSRIISLLKKNSRASNTEIAQSVGLSEGAVRQRIKSLLQKGTIKRFTIETSSEASNQAIVLVKAKRNTKKMMREITTLPGFRSGFEISGAYDACLILSAGSMEQLDNQIDQIRALSTVSDTRTFISLKEW
ncbi:winged helix-turn-helix transcriptional regulator [Candidatus Micrarchaeota archaeon]|nr:winged helix-turn-helix transcriptional regulator [Candidatus Micrarchaeota archaeon]MBD3418105.1 winged helix-turn-helix transcriptional regulator [Candidatus Micrarchaeota archaeon]